MKTMLTIAAILTAATLTGIFSTSVYAYDGGDESETNTQQVLKQKNVGRGESTKFNCGENDIKSGLIDAQVCGALDLELGNTGVPREICANGLDDDRDVVVDEADCVRVE